MDIQEVKNKLENTLKVFKDDLSGIQAGKVTDILLKNVQVSLEDDRKSYLLSIATIKIMDRRSIAVHPFSIENMLHIEKAIAQAGLGVSTGRENNYIKVTFPEITQERRIELSKIILEYTNKAKNSARDIRHSYLKHNKANSKEENIKLEKNIQKEIDSFNTNIDNLTKIKQNEILQI